MHASNRSSARQSATPVARPPSTAQARSGADEIGERVARQRRRRQLTVSELARRVGVSPSLISQIERGHSRPSVVTLFSLAQALEVSVDSLFRGDHASRPERVGEARVEPLRESPGGRGPRRGRHLVTKGSRGALDIDGGVRCERLTPSPLDELAFVELVYAPHAQSNASLYTHPGSEMVLMLEGRLDIFVGFERYRLEPGDSIHFPSSVPHRYVNPSDAGARAVSVILRDKSGDRSASTEQDS
jgi:transcriptional regulator with XRE-family HTH domain/quercetin dioxygenase-like cupin family protein